MPLAHLDRGAVEADRADVVLAAAVRAARHLDVDLPGQRVGDPHRLDPLLDRLVEAHRAGDPELAAVGARAGDDVVDLERAGAAEAELDQALPDVVHGLVADPAQDEVLLHGGPGVAAGELAHDRREPAQLLRGEIAAGDLDRDGGEAVLALRRDVRLAEALELGAIAVRARPGRVRAGGVRLLVIGEQQPVDREVALGDPVALELLLDHLAEGIDPDLVDQHLDPGPGAVDPQPLLAVEDPQAGLGDLEVVAVVELDELVERRSDPRHDRGAAADPDLDPADAVALLRDEADVVDPGDRDVLVGGRERRLDLARHQLRRRVADEVAHVGARVGGDVERARRARRRRTGRR